MNIKEDIKNGYGSGVNEKENTFEVNKQEGVKGNEQSKVCNIHKTTPCRKDS